MKKNIIVRLLAFSAAVLTIACNKAEKQEEVIVYTPSISYIVPTKAQPGEVVQIFGKHFSVEENENIVSFGSENATVLAAEKSRLYVAVPALEEGEYKIKVSVNDKESETVDFTCKIEDDKPLSITAISPEKGYPGAEVTITGVGFVTGTTTVTFDGIEAAVSSMTSSVIKATAPEHAKGEVDVVVTRGTKADTTSFTYKQLVITSNTPSEGNEGTEVTITGEGFSDVATENVVLIDSVACTVKTASETQINVEMPEMKTGTYSFTVKVANQSATGGSFQYKAKTYMMTVAGTQVQSYTDGSGTSAGLGIIQSITEAGNGKYYLTQRGGTGKDGIRVLDINGWSVTTLVPATDSAILNGHPWDATFDKSGNFYIAVKGKSSVAKVLPDGKASTVTFKNDSRSLKTNPMSVKVGKEGHIFVLNRGNTSYIAEFDSELTFIKEDTVTFMVECMCWNSDSTKMFLGANTNPFGIHALDIATGKTTQIAGTGVKPTAQTYVEGTEGQPLTATIGALEGLYLAKDGTLYFSDNTSFVVRKLVPGAGGDYSKGTVSLVAGVKFQALVITEFQGKKLATQAKFKYPCDIQELPDGSLLVADGTGYRVCRIFSE